MSGKDSEPKFGPEREYGCPEQSKQDLGTTHNNFIHGKQNIASKNSNPNIEIFKNKNARVLLASLLGCCVCVSTVWKTSLRFRIQGECMIFVQLLWGLQRRGSGLQKFQRHLLIYQGSYGEVAMKEQKCRLHV